MKSPYRPPREMLGELRRVLAAKPSVQHSPLEEAVELLHQSRRYDWVGVYLLVNRRLTRQAFCGAEAPCRTFAVKGASVGQSEPPGVVEIMRDFSTDRIYGARILESKSEIIVPIKIAGHMLGVMDIENEKGKAFAPEERVFLETVAALLARFFTGPGKYLVRKARESLTHNTAASPAMNSPAARAYHPGSEKGIGTGRSASAGEKSA